MSWEYLYKEGDDDDDMDFLCKKYEDGHPFPQGPKCTVKGEQVPYAWLTTVQEKVSLLRNLQTSLGLYTTIRVYDDDEERKVGVTPFLLVDSHESWFSKSLFFKYITFPSHKWQVWIGLPYGNAL